MLEVIGAAPGSRTDVDWPQVWRDSHEHRSVKERLDGIRQSRITEDKEPPILPLGQPKDTAYAAPFVRQWWLVQQRVAAQYWRTPSYIYSKIALTVGSVSIESTELMAWTQSARAGLTDACAGVVYWLQLLPCAKHHPRPPESDVRRDDVIEHVWATQ